MLARVTSSAPPPRRPGPFNPARELAVRVLVRVLAGETFAAPALDTALRSARLPGRDAGLATHIVYGTLRRHPSLTAALAPLLRGETHPKARALLLAGAFEKLHLGTAPHAVVSEYVNLAGGARLAPPGLVNAVLRRFQREQAPLLHAVDRDLSIRTAHPRWFVEALRQDRGEVGRGVLDDPQRVP